MAMTMPVMARISPMPDAPRYLQNHFLIALPGMDDPNFAGGVTLLCHHAAEGAMGLMLNRLAPLTLGDVFEQMGIKTFDLELAQSPVLLGGPVQCDRGFVLHTPDGGEWESTFPVSEHLRLTTSRDVLEAIAKGNGPRNSVVALGYAGWGEHQLEEEIQDNAWLTVEADPSVIFDTPLEQRWNAATRLIGIDPRLLAGYAGHA